MGSIWTPVEQLGSCDEQPRNYSIHGIFTRMYVQRKTSGVLEATMRWDEGGERVLYVEEGMVGHGKSGDVQRPGKMAHITVRGTRHRSAIGGREEMQLQTHAAFARGIWDLVVLCVLWVGAAGCQKKKGTVAAFYLKYFFFGSLCSYDPDP